MKLILREYKGSNGSNEWSQFKLLLPVREVRTLKLKGGDLVEVTIKKV